MLEQSLIDPEQEKKCECATDKGGKKKCGGKGEFIDSLRF